MVAPIEPIALTASSNCVDTLIGDIYIAEVGFERELALAERLGEHGIGCYVPTRIETRVWGGRRRQVRRPAIPGYAFVAGGIEGRDVAQIACDRRGRFVWGFVEWGLNADGTPSALCQRYLRRDLLRLEERLRHRPDTAFVDLLEGTLVEVISGPLKHQLGVIERRDSLSRFTVRTNMLGQSNPLELDPMLLQAV